MTTYLSLGLPEVLDSSIRRALDAAGHCREMGNASVEIAVIGISTAFPNAHITAISSTDWQLHVHDTLELGYAAVRDAALPMVAAGRGRIIVVCDDVGIRGAGQRSAAAAVSGGAVSLTKSLGRELAPYGVLVNAIATPLVAGPADDGVLPVKENDVADAVIYLTDSELTSLVGQVIACTGGAARSRI